MKHDEHGRVTLGRLRRRLSAVAGLGVLFAFVSYVLLADRGRIAPSGVDPMGGQSGGLPGATRTNDGYSSPSGLPARSPAAAERARVGSIRLRVIGRGDPLRVALCDGQGERIGGTARLAGSGSEVVWAGLLPGIYRWELVTTALIDMGLLTMKRRGQWAAVPPAALSDRGTRLSNPLEVAAGSETLVEVALTGLSVFGVVDSSGHIATVSVRRKHVDGQLRHYGLVARVICEPSGAFALRDVAPGSYILTARWMTGTNQWWVATREFDVRDGSVDLSVVSARAGVLSGRMWAVSASGMHAFSTGQCSLLVMHKGRRDDRAAWVNERLVCDMSMPFALHGIADGEYEVAVRMYRDVEVKGYSGDLSLSMPTRTGVVPGAPITIDMSIKRRCRVVLHSPRRIEDVTCLLLGDGKELLMEGLAEQLMFDMTPGEFEVAYVVGVDADGAGWYGRAPIANMESAVSVSMYRSDPVRGRVLRSVHLGEDNTVHLTVQGADQNPLWRCPVDDNGEFVLLGMGPDWELHSLQGFRVRQAVQGGQLRIEVSN